MELKCKLGSGFTDVVAIELKNPNGSNKTSLEQDAYLERLRGCNVATLVSNSYEEVIILLHEHYKSVKETHETLLAIGDKQQAKRIDFRVTTTLPTGAGNYRTRRTSSRSADTEAWTPRSCGSFPTSR